MSGKTDTVEDALRRQALLLVKMVGELFEQADKAETPEQFTAAARKAWMHNSLARAWIAEKRVVDAAFASAPLGKGGGSDGLGQPRGLDELEEQIKRGTERIQQLLAKPSRAARDDGGGGAGGSLAGLAGGAALAPGAAPPARRRVAHLGAARRARLGQTRAGAEWLQGQGGLSG